MAFIKTTPLKQPTLQSPRCTCGSRPTGATTQLRESVQPPPGGAGALGTTAGRNQAPMDKRRFELSPSCGARARQLGLRTGAWQGAHEFFSDEQIVAIAAGRCDAVVSAAEQAMIAFARQTASAPRKTTAGQVEALRGARFR